MMCVVQTAAPASPRQNVRNIPSDFASYVLHRKMGNEKEGGGMPVKLKVSNETSPSYQEEFLFDQDIVTIGRDSTNLLHLADARRVVSKQHAKIERHGGDFYLIDLESRNRTFLNGVQLTPYQE